MVSSYKRGIPFMEGAPHGKCPLNNKGDGEMKGGADRYIVRGIEWSIKIFK